MRFAKADVLIYFHFSRLVCFFRFFKRLFNYKKDFGGLRAITWEILQYTWNFDSAKIELQWKSLERDTLRLGFLFLKIKKMPINF